MVFQMDGGPITGLEDLLHHREAGLQVKPSAHDDMIHVGLGECRPHIVHPAAAKQLDIRHLQLLLHIVKDGGQYAQKQYSFRHAPSPAQ
jgi:hypothetical protein